MIYYHIPLLLETDISQLRFASSNLFVSVVLFVPHGPHFSADEANFRLKTSGVPSVHLVPSCRATLPERCARFDRGARRDLALLSSSRGAFAIKTWLAVTG